MGSLHLHNVTHQALNLIWHNGGPFSKQDVDHDLDLEN